MEFCSVYYNLEFSSGRNATLLTDEMHLTDSKIVDIARLCPTMLTSPN
jgi:hypothetical protein